MNERNDGGPAFPQFAISGEFELQQTSGLSLRDYFAAKAMQELVADEYPRHMSVRREDSVFRVDMVARYAYEMADAMLKARTK